MGTDRLLGSVWVFIKLLFHKSVGEFGKKKNKGQYKTKQISKQKKSRQLWSTGKAKNLRKKEKIIIKHTMTYQVMIFSHDK